MSHKTVHISPELHKKLKMEALKHNLSLRELVESKLVTPWQGESLQKKS